MPIIRCSKEVYNLLQREAIESGNPVSIILDRKLFGAPPVPGQMSLIPAPAPASPAAGRKKPVKARKRIKAQSKPHPKPHPTNFKIVDVVAKVIS